MINAAPRGLAQCPWCTHRHLASFFYLPIQERETCTGLPSSGRTSRSTSDFGTHVGLEKGGVWGLGSGKPTRQEEAWSDLSTYLFSQAQRFKNTWNRQQKKSTHVPLLFFSHFPPPVYNRHQTASVKQPSLLCSHLSLKKKHYKYLLSQEPRHQANSINTHEKGKEKQSYIFSDNPYQYFMI